MGRKPTVGELIDKRKEVYFRPSELEALETGLSAGTKVGSFIRAAALEKFNEITNAPARPFSPIRIKGVVTAGPTVEVMPIKEHLVATPPYSFQPGNYALIVVGNALQPREYMNVPHGAFAVFLEGGEPFHNTPVDVEWTEGKKTVRTLMLYTDDGTHVVLKPIGKSQKEVRKAAADIKIHGVFRRAWVSDDEEA